MKSKKIIIMIIIIALMVLGITMFLITHKSIKQEDTNVIQKETITSGKEKVNFNDMEPVKSAIAFFTVQNCINKYIGYVTEENADGIYKVLDKDFIQENNITKDNVVNKIPKLEEEVEFSAEQMYMEEINENQIKYYAVGVIAKSDGHGEVDEENFEKNEENNFHIMVLLNVEEMTFSIIPL